MALKKKPEPVSTKKKMDEVKKPAQTLPAVREKAQVPSTGVIDWAEDAGAGLEEVDKTSLAIPFLILLQSNSPEVLSIPDAKAGMFLNKVTNELFEEVEVIPCYYQRQFIRWAPRSTGGGFQGVYNAKDVDEGNIPGMSIVDRTIFMDLPEGIKTPFDKEGKPAYDHLADVRNFFSLIRNGEGHWIPLIMSLGSTQIKNAKNWMSLIMGMKVKDRAGKDVTPPIYSHSYLLTSKEESNTKGKWQGWDITLSGPVVDPAVRDLARNFYLSVKSEKVVASPPPSHEETERDNGKF